MHNLTRQVFNSYLGQVAELNGVSDATKKFVAAASVSQTMENHIQESSAFLGMVNSIGVDEQTAEKLGLGIGSTIAGRTDTNAADRATQDPSGVDDRSYFCKQTNFDTHLGYAKLDAWAKFPDFEMRIRNQILRQSALDRIMIGWNGLSAAAATNRVTNPLLQDVNIGWLKKLQTEAVGRYMTEGADAVGAIHVGAGGHYANLDALVYDMRSNLLAPWHRRNSNLVVVCSSDMVDEKYFPLVEMHGNTPTEAKELDLMISNKRLGGLRVAEVPFFPERTLFITQLSSGGDSNLSVYWQNDTRRRTIVDNAKRDRVENYESVNEAYVIEDLTCTCAAVNVKFPNAAGDGWQ
ncbi:MAG: phage major capsid protein, P2 family [Candidatus Sedimenticola sp. (ex Thyasira tokunagai)]